eukprot:scaffold15872_cov122-Isochrysis_galbana.AAC.4
MGIHGSPAPSLQPYTHTERSCSVYRQMSAAIVATRSSAQYMTLVTNGEARQLQVQHLHKAVVAHEAAHEPRHVNGIQRRAPILGVPTCAKASVRDRK